MNQPLDKGRVAYVADRYQTSELDQQGQPKMKNRYASLGRATKWPKDGGGENIEIELDSVPVGATGTVKMVIFWDSQDQNNQQGQQYAQQPQGNQPPAPPQNQPMGAHNANFQQPSYQGQ